MTVVVLAYEFAFAINDERERGEEDGERGVFVRDVGVYWVSWS